MNDNEYGFNPDNTPQEPNEPINEAEPNTPQENVTDTSTDYSEPIYKSADTQDNFSHYCDPVNDDNTPPANESAYSPYSDKQYDTQQPNYSQQYAQQNNYSQYNAYQNPSPQQNTEYNYQNTAVEAPKKKKGLGFKGFLIAVIAVVLCTSVVFAIYVKNNNKETNVAKKTADSTQIKISDSANVGEASKDSVSIAEKAQKFNVGILLYGRTQSFASSAANSLVGEGSGIIMGEDSSKKYTYIITCAHVVSGVDTSGYTMTVQDCDGNTYDGELVGYDSKTDIGVIKIEKTGLTAAEFGDSSNLVIGQQVYAIGNPGGVEFFGSFTNGMISAIDRPINSESGYEMKCIQHTTPINSGNSGGALLNEYGQVIGINSSKIVSTGYEGMAFSIPITDAKSIIDDIISNGYVTNRPKLGITYAPASQYREYSMIVALKDLPAGSLIIASISDDSSLANTKAKAGDMIISVDGEDLTSADILLDKIENGKVGDTLKLTLCRVNDNYSIDKFTVDVKLVEDKGTAQKEETTSSQSYSEEDFYNYFFNGGGY